MSHNTLKRRMTTAITRGSECYDSSLSGATATGAAAAGVKSDTAAKRNRRNESYTGQAEEGRRGASPVAHRVCRASYEFGISTWLNSKLICLKLAFDISRPAFYIGNIRCINPWTPTTCCSVATAGFARGATSFI